MWKKEFQTKNLGALCSERTIKFCQQKKEYMQTGVNVLGTSQGHRENWRARYYIFLILIRQFL
jgi:hypothetical protein